MHAPYEITVPDPGAGHRLGPDARQELRSQIRQADRGGAAAVLLSVAGDAWHQDADDDTGRSAQQVGVEGHRLVTALFAVRTPVVVQLAGRVSGLGLGLALACDLRFGTGETTLSVGSPETAAALLGGTSWLLTHRAGAAVAAHLSWTGQELTAAEARALTLLSGVSSDGSAAREAAERLARLPGGATTALKRSLNGRLRADLEEQLDYDSWLAAVARREV